MKIPSLLGTQPRKGKGEKRRKARWKLRLAPVLLTFVTDHLPCGV